MEKRWDGGMGWERVMKGGYMVTDENMDRSGGVKDNCDTDENDVGTEESKKERHGVGNVIEKMNKERINIEKYALYRERKYNRYEVREKRQEENQERERLRKIFFVQSTEPRGLTLFSKTQLFQLQRARRGL